MAAETETMSAVQVERPRIRVRAAQKSFAGRVVVDIDDIIFGESPIEGLIGPNGAGKTTLMRMIMHSIPLDTGTITLDRPDAEDVVLSTLPASRLAGPLADYLDIPQTELFEQVLEEYREAMHYSADFPFARYNLGNLFNSLGQPDRAIEEYDRIAVENRIDIEEAPEELR